MIDLCRYNPRRIPKENLAMSKVKICNNESIDLVTIDMHDRSRFAELVGRTAIEAMRGLK